MLLFRGDLAAPGTKVRQTAIQASDAPGAAPSSENFVSNVVFGDRSPTDGGGYHLFITTCDQSLSGRGLIVSCDTGPALPTPVSLDDLGAMPKCVAYHPRDQQLMVAREDAIYFFTPDDRGAAVMYNAHTRKTVWATMPCAPE